MDALSEILGSLRIRGSVYFCDFLVSPWELKFANEQRAIFHLIRRGRARIAVAGDGFDMETGDFVFVAPGVDHRMVRDDDDGAETLMLCGYCEFDKDADNLLMRSLPNFVLLQSDDLNQWPWIPRTLEHLSAEFQSSAPGSELTVDKLTEVLLVQLIRADFGRASRGGLVAALQDKRIAVALDAVHEAPAEHWTIEAAASRASMSRSGFARRFRQLTGLPFFDYLTQLRMRHARRLLANGGIPVADIGLRVGYVSEPSFVKAFRKHHAKTPRAYRMEHST